MITDVAETASVAGFWWRRNCDVPRRGTALRLDSRSEQLVHWHCSVDRPELERRVAVFAHDVFQLCSTLRARSGGREPANQLQDAASSAAANYRAAGRARSAKEFTAKLGMVNEEADEVVYWLEFVRHTLLASSCETDSLLEESRQLRAIFAASYATARRHRNARSNRR